MVYNVAINVNATESSDFIHKYDTETEADILQGIYTKFPITLGSPKLPTKSKYVCVCQSEKNMRNKDAFQD